MAQQFQGRGRVHVQRLAQRLDFRQQAAGVQLGRPLGAPGQLVRQQAGAAQGRGARLAQALHGEETQRHHQQHRLAGVQIPVVEADGRHEHPAQGDDVEHDDGGADRLAPAPGG